MRFSCVKENLERAITIAERFTGKNVSLPILSNILIESSGNTIFATATNLEHAVQITIPGKVSRAGRVSIPGKIISSLIQSIKEDKIDLEEKQNSLYIHTNTRDTRINGVSPEDFPIIPKVKKSFYFEVDSFAIKNALEKVLPAVSLSEFKPELSGIYFRIASNTVQLAATDTFRLSEKTILLDKKNNEESFSFILPYKVSMELGRVLQEKDDLNITVGENQILLEADGLKIVSRLVDGKFPEYSTIVPKQFELTSYVKREEVVQAVRSSSIFASKIQDVTLSFSKNSLEITSQNQDVGEHKTTIPVSSTGKDITISFNYRYLLDGLTVLDEEEIYFGVNGENSPSLLRNKSDGSFLYVLMPIRLG